MADAANIPDLDALLRNDAWMRRLAARLVQGADVADDLVQEALLVAITSPPKRAGRLDAWLRGVMRNIAGHLVRRERERPEREGAAVQGGAGRAPTQLVQQVRLQGTLVEAVLALPEPWQTAVLLRFYADMTSVEIGRQLGVPDATVRSWLHRALAELRLKIEHDTCGPGGDLRAVLLPLALMRGSAHAVTAAAATKGSAAAQTAAVAPAAGATTTTHGVFLMALKTKVAAAALVCCVGVGAWWMTRPQAPVVERSMPGGDAAVAHASDAPVVASAAPTTPIAIRPFVDDTAASKPAAPAAQPESTRAFGTVRGIVYDAESRPVPGAHVFVADPEADAHCGDAMEFRRNASQLVAHEDANARLRLKQRPEVVLPWSHAVTDADGRFDIATVSPGIRRNAVAFAPELGVAILQGFAVPAGSVQDVVLCLSGGVDIVGTVNDEAGKPIDRVWVSVALVGGDDSPAGFAFAESGSDGRWHTWPLPGLRGEARFTVGGGEPTRVPIADILPGEKTHRVDVVLKTLRALRGKLVQEDGTRAHVYERVQQMVDQVLYPSDWWPVQVKASISDPETDAAVRWAYENMGAVKAASDSWEIKDLTRPVQFVSAWFEGTLLGKIRIDPAAAQQPDLVVHLERIPLPPRTGTLIVRVRDQQDSRPVAVGWASGLGPEADAALPFLQGANAVQHRHLQDVQSGVLTFDKIAEGRWYIEIRADSYATWSGVIAVSAGDPPTEIDVPLQKATAAVRGIVRNADGTPAVGAWVRLRCPDGRPALFERSGFARPCTNAEGRFEFIGVAPGEYVVTASSPRLNAMPRIGPALKHVTATNEGTAVSLTLGEGCRVEILVDAPGGPVSFRILAPDGDVVIDQVAENTLWLTTTVWPPYFILPPGPFIAEIHCAGHATTRVPFTAAEGARIPCTLAPPRR